MQIRCVSSSEIPLRSRRGPNEKSWMKNPSERQSQSSPSSGSSFNAHWIEIRFQIRSNVASRAATGRRIYLRGSALPAASSATLRRNRAIPLVPRSPYLRLHTQPSWLPRVITELRHSYLPERDERSRSWNANTIASSAWRVASRKLDKRKTRLMLEPAGTSPDILCCQPANSHQPRWHVDLDATGNWNGETSRKISDIWLILYCSRNN